MTIFLEGGDIGDIFVPMVMICVKVQWHYLSYSSEIKLEHNHWNDFASIAVGTSYAIAENPEEKSHDDNWVEMSTFVLRLVKKKMRLCLERIAVTKRWSIKICSREQLLRIPRGSARGAAERNILGDEIIIKLLNVKKTGGNLHVLVHAVHLKGWFT